MLCCNAVHMSIGCVWRTTENGRPKTNWLLLAPEKKNNHKDSKRNMNHAENQLMGQSHVYRSKYSTETLQNQI